jgi:hypothetical protein
VSGVYLPSYEVLKTYLSVSTVKSKLMVNGRYETFVRSDETAWTPRIHPIV